MRMKVLGSGMAAQAIRARLISCAAGNRPTKKYGSGPLERLPRMGKWFLMRRMAQVP